MTKRLGICLVVSLFILMGLLGCAMKTTPVSNTTDLQKVDFSQPMKEGQACGTKIVYFGPFGDTSVVKAVKDAGIRKVEVVEYKSMWYLVVTQECVLVYGH